MIYTSQDWGVDRRQSHVHKWCQGENRNAWGQVLSRNCKRPQGCMFAACVQPMTVSHSATWCRKEPVGTGVSRNHSLSLKNIGERQMPFLSFHVHWTLFSFCVCPQFCTSVLTALQMYDIGAPEHVRHSTARCQQDGRELEAQGQQQLFPSCRASFGKVSPWTTSHTAEQSVFLIKNKQPTSTKVEIFWFFTCYRIFLCIMCTHVFVPNFQGENLSF